MICYRGKAPAWSADVPICPMWCSAADREEGVLGQERQYYHVEVIVEVIFRAQVRGIVSYTSASRAAAYRTPYAIVPHPNRCGFSLATLSRGLYGAVLIDLSSMYIFASRFYAVETCLPGPFDLGQLAREHHSACGQSVRACLPIVDATP